MTLYEKYTEQKNKYCPVFKNMKITYNKEKNSISYKDGIGNWLCVQYSQDMKIESVFTREKDSEKTQCLNKLLSNLGSTLFYYDFSSSYNPYNEVHPPHMCSLESQGMFDIMMEIANEYAKENLPTVQLGVKYEGWGWAGTPVSVARRGKLGYREYPYDENKLYTADYFEFVNKQHDTSPSMSEIER